MKGIAFKVVGWLLVVLAILVGLSEGFLFLLSGWGICGDAYKCNPIQLIFSGSPNALVVVGLNVAFIFALISVILIAYTNFKLAKIINENEEFSNKGAYLVSTICAFLSGVFAISGFFEIIRSSYFLLVFNTIVLFVSIYFTVKVKRL